MAESGHVALALYNVLGEKVATLVDATRSAGEYHCEFDVGDLAGGVYFCRFEAGGLADTHKLVVLK
jgi:hypothetical protein